MALARTTLSAAIGIDDSKMLVASATGFAAGYVFKIDGEVFRVAKAYVAGSTTVPFLRGQEGTVATTHPSSAGVVVGVASDWSNPAAGSIVPFPLAGKSLLSASYSASGAITLPVAGSDLEVQINGTTICAMTVAAPTKDLDGCKLYISSNGAAAHTVTFTGGLSGAGTSYDVLTVNATAPVTLGPFVAINSLWQAPATVAVSGTVTNVTAALA